MIFSPKGTTIYFQITDDSESIERIRLVFNEDIQHKMFLAVQITLPPAQDRNYSIL